METTQQQPVQVSNSPRDLEQENVSLWQVNAALHKRVEFLEQRLQQRSTATVKDYQALRKYFDVMKGRIMDIFMDLPVTMGLSHPEIAEAFRERYPSIHSVDLPRRTRELVTEGLLWSREENVVRFYLKLKGDGLNV